MAEGPNDNNDDDNAPHLMNVQLVRNAYRQQLRYCEMLKRLVDERLIPFDDILLLNADVYGNRSQARVYDFTNYAGADDLRLWQVFVMFQNWTVLHDPGIRIAIVKVFITGVGEYQFQIIKSEGDAHPPHNHHRNNHGRRRRVQAPLRIGQLQAKNHARYDNHVTAAVSYNQLFEVIRRYGEQIHDYRRAMQYMAHFILETAVSSFRQPRENRLGRPPPPPVNVVPEAEVNEYYEFLDAIVADYSTHPFEREITIKVLLCDIMVVALVAEAARPRHRNQAEVDNFDNVMDRLKLPFETWMDAVEEMRIEHNDPRNLDDEYRQYFRQLNEITGITKNSHFTGRVPYADNVFRGMLTRIRDGRAFNVPHAHNNHGLKNIFKIYYPMHKKYNGNRRICREFKESGANYGRFHILIDVWIRQDAPLQEQQQQQQEQQQQQQQEQI